MGKNATAEELEPLNEQPGECVLSVEYKFLFERPGIECYSERSYCSDVNTNNYIPFLELLLFSRVIASLLFAPPPRPIGRVTTDSSCGQKIAS